MRRRLGLLLTAILAGTIGVAGLPPGAAQAVSGWRSVAAGESVSCGVQNAGTLWCWGYNGFGTLGQGDSVDRSTPAQVGLDRDWASVTVGYYFACGVKTTGIALCWGIYDYGQLGVGHWSPTTYRSPERVAGDHLWVRLSAGGVHTCGIDVAGALWCWGDNSRGELGVPEPGIALAPVRVGLANIWTSVVAAGQSTCATQRAGHRYCWGANSVGQLGLDDEADRAAPTSRIVSEPAVGLLAGREDHYCYVAGDSRLFCWGGNTYGQLGVGDGRRRRLPTAVLDAGWDTVTTGTSHTCGMIDDLRLCWGRNQYGQLGLGDTVNRTRPSSVFDGQWATLAAGSDHTCGILGTDLYCWGANYSGQLGIGPAPDQTRPVRVG